MCGGISVPETSVFSVQWSGSPNRANRLEDLLRPLDAPVALVHVRLEADRVDPDAGVEAVLDDPLVVGREVEVVEQERRAGVGRARRLERQPDDLDPADLAGRAG